MPHTKGILHGRYAVVSCHVERPLDDDVWQRFSALQKRRPGRFRIAALMRPPAVGEDETLWLERVREQGAWLRSHGLDVQFFCGGGWYLDAEVADAVAELGYTDCTATAFRPSYLEPDAAHVQLHEPAWLEIPSGRRLLELPTTHSIGMLARGL